MSIASIELKYPNAIWFDSHYSGGGSDGSVDAPYTTIGAAMGAAADGGVIAIKDGNHNVTQIVMGKSLTFVGESTEAILTTSGSGQGGAIKAYTTIYSIKLESLKVYHNSSSSTYGLIAAGSTADATVTVDGCILEMGPLTLAATNNRGWFSGANGPITSLTVSRSIILGGSGSSSFGFVIGGDVFQDGFHAVNFQSNTFIVTGGLATKFSSYSAGITSSTFKNNIFIGNDNGETLGFTPLIYSYNCFNKCAVTTGGTNNLFDTDPQFVDAANGDFNLRPVSPLIGAATPTPSPTGTVVYIKPGSGSGSGTELDPYHFPGELTTAETAAGNGGTILFLDGTYEWAGNLDFTAGGFSSMTYKSLNLHGAYLFQSTVMTATKLLTLGSVTTDTIYLEGFRAANFIYKVPYLPTPFNTIINLTYIKHIDTQTGDRGTWGIFSNFGNDSANQHKLFGCEFSIYAPSSERFFFRCPNSLVDSCTFFWRNSLASSNAPQGSISDNPHFKNCIILSENASAVNSNALTMSRCTSCCITDFNQTSGGTDNVFNVDPLFMDASSGNFKLRPISPLIGGIPAEDTTSMWVDPTNGDDLNNGSTKALAKETFAAAESAASANQTIKVVSGTHSMIGNPNLTSNALILADVTTGLTYEGEDEDTILDFTGITQTDIDGCLVVGNINNGNDITIKKLQFNNMTIGAQNRATINIGTSSLNRIIFDNCKFLNMENGPGSLGAFFSRKVGLRPDAGIHGGYATDSNWTFQNCIFTTLSGGESLQNVFFEKSGTSTTSKLINCTVLCRADFDKLFKTNVDYMYSENCIFYSSSNDVHPNDANIADLTGPKTNVFYSFGDVTDTSLGTVYSVDDPIFLSLSNDEFNLRPSSPFIGKGI